VAQALALVNTPVSALYAPGGESLPVCNRLTSLLPALNNNTNTKHGGGGGTCTCHCPRPKPKAQRRKPQVPQVPQAASSASSEFRKQPLTSCESVRAKQTHCGAKFRFVPAATTCAKAKASRGAGWSPFELNKPDYCDYLLWLWGCFCFRSGFASSSTPAGCLLQLKHGLDEAARGAKSGCEL
jgi:hypothetical protein